MTCCGTLTVFCGTRGNGHNVNEEGKNLTEQEEDRGPTEHEDVF